MRERLTTMAAAKAAPEIEITDAAIVAYAALVAAVGRRITTHPVRDGGLICEDRTREARPTLWRISPGGAVLADSRYSLAHRAFVTPSLPPGL